MALTDLIDLESVVSIVPLLSLIKADGRVIWMGINILLIEEVQHCMRSLRVATEGDLDYISRDVNYL